MMTAIIAPKPIPNKPRGVYVTPSQVQRFVSVSQDQIPDSPFKKPVIVIPIVFQKFAISV